MHRGRSGIERGKRGVPEGRRRPRGRGEECRGYTLLELIVVMALIGIVFFFALPRFEGSFMMDDAKKSARWLIGKIQMLREESVRTRRDRILHIDLDTNRVWETVEDMSLEEADRAMQHARQLPGDARLAGVDFPVRGRVASGRADIRFHGDGHTDRVLIHLRHGSTVQSFLMEPFLARVKIFDTMVGFEDLR